MQYDEGHGERYAVAKWATEAFRKSPLARSARAEQSEHGKADRKYAAPFGEPAANADAKWASEAKKYADAKWASEAQKYADAKWESEVQIGRNSP